MASDRSGYQASPHPSAFSAARAEKRRIEKSAESRSANESASNSHMALQATRDSARRHVGRPRYLADAWSNPSQRGIFALKLRRFVRGVIGPGPGDGAKRCAPGSPNALARDSPTEGDFSREFQPNSGLRAFVRNPAPGGSAGRR